MAFTQTRLRCFLKTA